MSLSISAGRESTVSGRSDIFTPGRAATFIPGICWVSAQQYGVPAYQVSHLRNQDGYFSNNLIRFALLEETRSVLCCWRVRRLSPNTTELGLLQERGLECTLSGDIY